MKHVTASEARKNWFRLLDEVAAGAVVVIERGGRRIVIQREAEQGTREVAPDYGALISVPAAERADSWRWEWDESEGELSLAEEPASPGDEPG